MPFFSSAQGPLVKQWDMRYGGNKDEYLFALQQTTDGGYILGGYSASDSTGDKTQHSWGSDDYWVVKTDATGKLQWEKRFGGYGQDRLTSLEQTSDGGYILGGISVSNANGDKSQSAWGFLDYWVIKVDASGIKQWDRRFGGTNNDYLNVIRQTPDGGYIMGGYSASDSSGNKTQSPWGGSNDNDYWVVKIDATGNLQWERIYGGAGDDQLTTIGFTGDGGYILGGASGSGVSGNKTATLKGVYDYWLVKIDSLGNMQWDKAFGGTGLDWLMDMKVTRDKGFILAGIARSGANGDKTQPVIGTAPNYWLVKTDSMGLKQWDKAFGAVDREDDLYSVIQTLDDGYLISGTSYSILAGNDKSEPNLGPEQAWLVKTDALGVKQWDKTIFTDGHDENSYTIQTAEGCFVTGIMTTGNVAGYKTQLNWDTATANATYDFWLVKFCDSTFVSLPKAVFTSSDTVFCSSDGGCVDFFDQSTGNPTSWQWYFPGAVPDTSSSQNPTSICYVAAGRFPVTLVVSNSGGQDSITYSQFISVGQAPSTPVITVSNDTLKCTPAASYQWYFNFTPIPGANDSIYITIQPGTYTVLIADINGCESFSNPFVITSVDEVHSLQNSILIFPNPVSSELKFIVSSQMSPDEEIAITDVTGKMIRSETVKKQDSYYSVSTSGLNNGIYFLKITIDGQVLSKRFVVLH